MEACRVVTSGTLAASIERKVEQIFARLGDYPFLTPEISKEFGYYRKHFIKALHRIDAKIARGGLRPLSQEGFPYCRFAPGSQLRIALFIGSFDPFQMTHLSTALHFLASPASTADAILVIPEGGTSSLKPNRSEHSYRLDILNRQLLGVFEPLVIPMDMGAEADTLRIIESFIARYPRSQMEVTHLIGSDVAPYAARLMEEDLRVWNASAKANEVDFNYRMFMVRRSGSSVAAAALKTIRGLGVKVQEDRHIVIAPSSTDFRERGAFTIVFPTESMLSHLEILFRYRLNKPWMQEGDEGAEGPGRAESGEEGH